VQGKSLTEKKSRASINFRGMCDIDGGVSCSKKIDERFKVPTWCRPFCLCEAKKGRQGGVFFCAGVKDGKKRKKGAN
jgi:hypothetical protein